MSNNNISIRSILIIVFITLMLATVGVISYIVFSSWLSSAEETTTKIAEDMNAETFRQIDTFINVPVHMNDVNHKLIENGILNISDEAAREKFFVGVLQSHTGDIYSFSYGTENGEYYGARRNEKGIIEIMRNNSSTGGNSWYYSVNDDLTAGELTVQAGKFDPRTRDWYNAAKEAKSPAFSPIYKHFVMDDLTLSAACPIYTKDGMLQGVMGTHIILSNIDGFLKDTVQDEKGFAMIVEKDTGFLVANSFGMDNFSLLEDSTLKRHKLIEAENQTIVQAYQRYIQSNESYILIENKNNSLYFNFTDYCKDGLDWLIITAVPQNLLMSGFYNNLLLTFVLVLFAVFLSLAVFYFLTNKLISPIDKLKEAAESFSSGDLSRRVSVVRNDEIGGISKSFNNMADTIHLLVNNLELTVKKRTEELVAANDALIESKDQLRLILDSTEEAVYGVGMDGNCTFCNTSCIAILGYTHQDDLLGKNMHLQIHHSHKDGTPFPIEECKINRAFREGTGMHVSDEVLWRADGTSFDAEYSSYPQYKNGIIVGAVITFWDISERKKDEEQIKYLSCHDSLTGLFNRRCLEDALKKVDTPKHLPISIIFGDVNGLKMTNDIFGHTAGDKLIIKTSEVLKRACRKGDIVARVGGDEFIMLLPNTDASIAEKIIARVKNELSEEKIDAIKCSIALGYYTKISEYENIERAMENAENEMYTEKTMNRKTINSEMINTIITTLHSRIPFEKKHSENVSALSQKIGQALDLPKTELKKLKDAGFLHDIGKIVVADSILLKGAALVEDHVLTEEEENEIQQHSVVGYRILNLFDDTLDLADGVYGHHEYWDGSGYPKKLKGEEIPRLARIIAVANMYDYLTNPMKVNSISHEKALQEIRNMSEVQLDPNIVDAFIKIMSFNS